MTDPANLKPLARLPPLPTEVFADPGRHDWYFRDKKPDSVARYVRDDMSSPLGAVAMREAAAQHLRGLPDVTLMTPDQAVALRIAADGIDRCPLPTHAALLAAALKLPEVAALRDAVSAEILARTKYEDTPTDRGGTTGTKGRAYSAWLNARAAVLMSITALEARHD